MEETVYVFKAAFMSSAAFTIFYFHFHYRQKKKKKLTIFMNYGKRWHYTFSNHPIWKWGKSPYEDTELNEEFLYLFNSDSENNEFEDFEWIWILSGYDTTHW